MMSEELKKRDVDINPGAPLLSQIRRRGITQGDKAAP
jgi:hypothetical protein